jgi:vancomycin resistance protein VanJ
MLAPQRLAHQAQVSKHIQLVKVSASAQLGGVAAKGNGGGRRWLRRLLVTCAFAYPAALAVLALGLYYLGESWWVTAVALYAPRLPLAVPLPFATLTLWLTGLRRYLWTQVAAAVIVVFPLLGFVPPMPVSARVGAPTLRVLSFNVNSGLGGQRAIADEIAAASPDVVLLQEAPFGGAQLAEALRAHYPYVESSTQFIVASRYRVASSSAPEPRPFAGHPRTQRFMRYMIETPLGSLVFFNVHPISPRGVLHVRQFRAALQQLRSGEVFAGDPERDVQSNVGLRALQIEGVAEAAASETLPVLIAGDTNLPGLSALFRRSLSGYADGFRVASGGFGYTYPEKYPFLRLDRILASSKLRFASFRVACHGVSDHLCVTAEIQTIQ